MNFETLAVHAGTPPETDTNQPLAQPIILGTNFERSRDGDYRHGWSYVRADNPNRHSWEQALAQLEGGAVAAAFSSGSAATAAVLQALSPGDHVIATDGFYGTHMILKEIMQPWGLQVSLIDTGDLAAVRAAVTAKTRLFWIETPTNPRMRISDIAALAQIAHAAGARLITDNTLSTPLLTRCFDLGADLVMHSTTKYLGGHSDVLGGAVISHADDDFFARIRQIQTVAGSVGSPFDCWLLQRGVRTLPLRVHAHSANALAVAEFLARHPAVQTSLYAGLKTHPGHQIAARQMTAFGGLLSFQVKGGQKEALAAMGKVNLIRRATSLGGTESTLDHRASVEPPGFGTPPNLLRLSVGIEHVDDIIADLEQALRG